MGPRGFARRVSEGHRPQPGAPPDTRLSTEALRRGRVGLCPESILDLQRDVGNAVVSNLIERTSAPVRRRGATVQRARLPKTAAPAGS